MSESTSFEKIKLILSDVDGVLTDGGISFDNNGIESVSYTHLTLPTILIV